MAPGRQAKAAAVESFPPTERQRHQHAATLPDGFASAVQSLPVHGDHAHSFRGIRNLVGAGIWDARNAPRALIPHRGERQLFDAAKMEGMCRVL